MCVEIKIFSIQYLLCWSHVYGWKSEVTDSNRKLKIILLIYSFLSTIEAWSCGSKKIIYTRCCICLYSELGLHLLYSGNAYGTNIALKWDNRTVYCLFFVLLARVVSFLLIGVAVCNLGKDNRIFIHLWFCPKSNKYCWNFFLTVVIL